MTGPEHYKRAQQIVAELEASAPHTPVEWHAARSAQAQVHATLAQVAATIDVAADNHTTAEAWVKAVLS